MNSTVHDNNTDITDLLARAKALIQSARFSEAESMLAGLLERQPDQHHEDEILYMLAVSRRYNNDVNGALEVLRRLLSSSPEHSRAWQEQGHTFLSLNRVDEATASFEKATRQNPGLPASWKALVNLYNLSGSPEKARFAGIQADYLASLPPELANVIDLVHEGKLYKAEQLCRHFLQNNRHHIEGMRLLADIGMRLRIYDDAEFLLESCVEFEPGNIQARRDYLNILNKKGKFQQALEQADTLLEHRPEDVNLQAQKAAALVGLGRVRDGIAIYQSVLDRQPDRSGIHLMLGHAQKALGELDAAIASYRSAYRIRPDLGDAFWSLANTKTYRFTDDEIEHIKRYEAKKEVALEDRIHLCFAAGKALEDRGDYDASFEYYERGNALKIRKTGYDPNQTDKLVQAQIDTCTAELFKKRGHLGYECSDPIFIVGLPRSGSTLLEQILASHSMVDATMELHNILGLAQRLRGRSAGDSSNYPQILWDLDDSYFRRFGEQFIENTRVYRGNAPFFIDKMPNNFMHIGLIRLILPNAKIIDARREPMACCFSNFKQLFGEGQDFTYGLHEIGRYYRAYIRLMEHWDNVLPGFVLRVMHEDVVNDFENQVRRILDFLDLPFEESCLNFHETERAVRTPSSEQVRQPIYKSGLEQWRHYESYLDPLKEALGQDILHDYRL